MVPNPYFNIFISQNFLQNPYLRIYISAYFNIFISHDPLQNPYFRIYISISLYFRILCKTHISGFMPQYPHISQNPLQDPYLRIHNPDPLQNPYLRFKILYKIHIFGFIFQYLYISDSSTKSISMNSYLNIHILGLARCFQQRKFSMRKKKNIKRIENLVGNIKKNIG